MAKMIVGLRDGKDSVQVSEIERPAPGPRDALVRIRACGICGSDLLLNLEKKTPDVTPTGHEVTGEIVEVGEDADPSRIGQRVAIDTPGSRQGLQQVLLL